MRGARCHVEPWELQGCRGCWNGNGGEVGCWGGGSMGMTGEMIVHTGCRKMHTLTLSFEGMVVCRR